MGVMNGTEKHSIKFEQSTVLIELVFDFALCLDFYDSVDIYRTLFPEGNCMPWIFGKMLFTHG